MYFFLDLINLLILISQRCFAAMLVMSEFGVYYVFNSFGLLKNYFGRGLFTFLYFYQNYKHNHGFSFFIINKLWISHAYIKQLNVNYLPL